MKVAQFSYLSPEAMRLRERDGTQPWAVHPCELDSVGSPRHATGGRATIWQQAVAAAYALRATIEAEPAKPTKRRKSKNK